MVVNYRLPNVIYYHVTILAKQNSSIVVKFIFTVFINSLESGTVPCRADGFDFLLGIVTGAEAEDGLFSKYLSIIVN